MILHLPTNSLKTASSSSATPATFIHSIFLCSFKNIMGANKFSQKLFDYRLKSRTTKSPVFYIISFILIFFFVYAENIFSSSSILQTINFTAQQSADELRLPQPEELIDLSSMVDTVDSFQLSPQENEDDTETSQQSTDELSLPQSDESSEKENGEDQEPQAEEEENEEEEDPLIPPENVSREERMTWFRRQLPELKILQSNSLSQQFHGRVMSFLNNGCSLLFHIIWLSPTRSFGKRDFLTMDTIFQVLDF